MLQSLVYKAFLIQTIFNLLALNQCVFAKALSSFEIKHADTLLADKNEITIDGNVVINYKDAVIEAPGGKIETDDEGQPQKAIFSGRTKLKLKDRRIEGDKITISLKEKIIYAEGNTISELKDKKNTPIIISSDYQKLSWSGEGAEAEGNIKTIYQDTEVTSEKAKIIYKSKKPNQAIFFSSHEQALLKQTNNKTYANEFVFDINTENIKATGEVKSTIWPDETKPPNKQDPVLLNTEDLSIDQDTGTITAKSDKKKVKLIYQDTRGESSKALLLRNKEDKKPEKIIFSGNANVTQTDKQISSEEVVFNFFDKKLTSNTKTNIRPKTLIFKMD